MTITVSTDGSALGNPNGPMGWAWADHEPAAGGKPGHEHAGDCDAGGATNGTNQIGELCAVLEALRAHPGSEDLVIETDSQYAINCSTKWVQGWKRNGWKNSQKKPVKNADLIRAIDNEIAHRAGSVRFVWVKGHAGNAGNEKVDELARTYAGDCRSHVREGYLPLEGWQSLLASEYSRGTDVPEDARMLMDGAISAAEYHMGRGQGDSATTGTGDSGADTANSSNSTKPRSIASMLAEPEGVSHDLADFGQTTDDDADDAVETTVLETEPAETTTMLETEATKVIPESSLPDAGGPAEQKAVVAHTSEAFSDTEPNVVTEAAKAVLKDSEARGGGVQMLGVDKIYPGSTVKALDDFNLEINPGEMVVLLGGSGCGKSTALRSLAGLEDIQAGRILVGGQDVTGVPINKRDMAMVFQAYSLFPHMTALQNVEFGLEIRGVDRAERRRQAMEKLELVGLADQAKKYTQQMSGGQQQRVALARALAVNPRVLLLDEPLSALDAKVRVQLRDEIRRIQLEAGTTTVFVTHDQEEALAVADRIGSMTRPSGPITGMRPVFSNCESSV